MRSHLKRITVATLATIAMALTGQLLGVGAATAAPAPAAVRVLYYDASQAAEFVTAVHQGAANWNARVGNVRLERWTAGHPVDIRVYADNNWPRAYVNSLGSGTVYMGRQATVEGHNPTRIAAHELGHILGLPDRRTGVCSELMSGSSAGTSCTSAFPNAQEITKVNSLFTSGALVTAGWRQDGA
ncbi:snapalysin family zinc-dependent metalloprotease [Catellatospora sp. KI3]|uniref:snapalysin family zinc-dependent metalloprotease n=1 Tax=Catellatospora sp. KI3 TaxID=3041620 RepID=UPI0024824B85|nr:snapalysin family zinc-dependent metalloprotease [Catellatospora sp. KI3]MDI1463216.1 snapalysin family zinc-dependent metalloprotease [Catellatospora sp. KI3]